MWKKGRILPHKKTGNSPKTSAERLVSHAPLLLPLSPELADSLTVHEAELQGLAILPAHERWIGAGVLEQLQQEPPQQRRLVVGLGVGQPRDALRRVEMRGGDGGGGGGGGRVWEAGGESRRTRSQIGDRQRGPRRVMRRDGHCKEKVCLNKRWI